LRAPSAGRAPRAPAQQCPVRRAPIARPEARSAELCVPGVRAPWRHRLHGRLCDQRREVAAVRSEQSDEQADGPPLLDRLSGAVLGEPDVEVAQLIEHRGAAGVRVDAPTVYGDARLADQAAQADL